MKKGLIILCLLLIPATLFASAFGLRAGVVAKYDKNLGDLTTVSSVEDIHFPQDFGFGADLNVKVLFFDADMTAYFGSNSDNKAVIDGLMSLNAGIDLSVVRITLGAGFGYVYNYETGKFVLKGNIENDTKFIDQLKNSPINLRACVGFDLDAVNISVFGIYNTNQSFNRFKPAEIFDGFNWKDIQVGVAASFNLIK